MFKLSLRNVVAHRGRLLMSLVAVTLALAFVTGTLIFTDGLSKAMSNVQVGRTPHVEAAVYPKTPQYDNPQYVGELTPADVDAVRKVDGVQRAEGQVITRDIAVIGPNNKPLGSWNGTPVVGRWTDLPMATGSPKLKLTEGRAPTGPNDVVVDEKVLAEAQTKVGGQLKLISVTNPAPFQATVVGSVVPNGGSDNTWAVQMSDAGIAKHVTRGAPQFSTIEVQAKPGTDTDALAAAVKTSLARHADPSVKSSAEVLRKAEGSDKATGFISYFLLAFAGIAMLVSIFLIVNTFTMIVAQRTRELALLRALGGSPGQVRNGVIIEAFVVGALGGLLGVACGYGMATVIAQVLKRFDMDLGAMSMPVGTIALSVVLGIVVTVLAASIPAFRASRIPPVAAMQDDFVRPEKTVGVASWIGLAMTILGVIGGVVCFVADIPQRGLVLGVSGAAVLIGSVLCSPLLGRPILMALGALYSRLAPGAGKLAHVNSMRNPRRTAATAAALMVGLSIVTAVGVAADSMRASTQDLLKSRITSDFIVSPSGMARGVSDDVVKATAAVPGVQGVYPTGYQSVEYKHAKGSGNTSITVGEMKALEALGAIKLDGAQGKLTDYNATTIAIAKSKDGATKLAAAPLTVGDTVTLTINKAPRTYTVGIVLPHDKAGNSGESVFFHPDAIKAAGKPVTWTMAGVKVADGANATDVRHKVDAALAENPLVNTITAADMANQISGVIGVMLYIVYGLLALAIIIAILGIINTLAMSVLERTREIGLLRAVGMTRQQVTWMIRLESMSVALLGALLGVAVGLGFGLAMQRLLAAEGLDTLSIPWAMIGAGLLVSALVGMLAAVWPAWRASRQDVLEAIATA